jgi:YHS domain-containing protein
MKNISKIACFGLLGVAFVATPLVTLADGCCPAAASALGASAAKSLADAPKADAAARPYPLDTCIVTDEKLDADPDMKSYTFVHQGQEIKLCCKSCKKKFDKDPAKYLKKLADAAAKK